MGIITKTRDRGDDRLNERQHQPEYLVFIRAINSRCLFQLGWDLTHELGHDENGER
jgi:hypothetical protein